MKSCQCLDLDPSLRKSMLYILYMFAKNISAQKKNLKQEYKKEEIIEIGSTENLKVEGTS